MRDQLVILQSLCPFSFWCFFLIAPSIPLYLRLGLGLFFVILCFFLHYLPFLLVPSLLHVLGFYCLYHTLFPFLFINHLHNSVVRNETVSTRYVRRSVYLVFFGPPNAPVRTARPADLATPISPLFVPDNGSEIMIDHPLSDADMGEARQGVAHPVYSPRKTPAVAVEQGPLEREDEEMAAAEAAEQEYLQLQETTIVEQSPRQEEDEEMAAAKTTKQDYLQQEEKERAVAAAQEQEQAQQEAANTAEQEWLEKEREAEERTAQDRALALAHLEQGNKKSFAQSNAILFERSSSTTQLDLSMDVPSIITQLRQPSDSPDRDQSPVIELYGLATQSLTKTASGSHTTEAATGEISPQRTVTTALEPITEEVEVSSPRSSVIIESDRQRQLREQAAERRRADKEKVENSKRSVVEEDETFIRTHGTEDLFTDESVNEVVIPPELPTAPLLPSDSASDRPQQDRIQATDTATSAETTEPLPQVIVTQTQPKPKPGRKPQGIQKARKSGQARGKEATKCASIDPSARPLTQMEFHGMLTDEFPWLSSNQSVDDGVRTGLPSLPEPSSGSALARL